jgi:endogenous inhibitor of DNA gyrase (YacG/DUF329 family)
MATVQIKCPETGKAVEVWHYRPGDIVQANRFQKLIPCPHCGSEHTWSSHDRGLAVQALQTSPTAARVLVEGDRDSRSATVLS